MSKAPGPHSPHDRVNGRKVSRPDLTRAEIEAALGYIQRHACDGLSPAMVVKELHAGGPLGAFSRQFRAATGLTLRSAIRQRQVEEARRLLLRTELTPQYIAEYCGFRDVHAAAGAFRAAGGEVPHRLLAP